MSAALLWSRCLPWRRRLAWLPIGTGCILLSGCGIRRWLPAVRVDRYGRRRDSDLAIGLCRALLKLRKAVERLGIEGRMLLNGCFVQMDRVVAPVLHFCNIGEVVQPSGQFSRVPGSVDRRRYASKHFRQIEIGSCPGPRAIIRQGLTEEFRRFGRIAGDAMLPAFRPPACGRAAKSAIGPPDRRRGQYPTRHPATSA